MRGFAYRLMAYLLTGLSVGFALWLMICRVPSDTGMIYPVLAGALLLFGVFAAFLLLRRPVFRSRPEEMIVSPGQILASDLASITAASVAAFFIADGFSERLFGIRACVTDPLAADVIAFMFLPTAIILALFVTQTGGQRIRIDEKEIRIKGISGSSRMPWEDVVSLRPDRQHVLVGRVGFLIPRHLRTNIVITSRNGENATIFDPGTAGARKALLVSLQDSMPAAQRSLLEEVEEEWR